MTVINTNVQSLLAQNSVSKNTRAMSEAMDQLSTGKRINSASDDAAGLAISSRMTSQINGLDTAVRNANDGISLLQTAEGATVEISNMLQRMRELAIQSQNETYSNSDREFLDLEFQQLSQEIGRIAANTQWNGMNILDGTKSGGMNFQVGGNAGQTIDVALSDLRELDPRQAFSSIDAVAQSGTLQVLNNLADGETASLTIGGQTFTVTGATGTSVAAVDAVAETGNFAITGDLAAGDTATLTIGDRSFTVTGTEATAQTESFALSTVASTADLGVTVNGQSFTVADADHNAVTAASAATLLAAQINREDNVAQVNAIALSSITATGGASITINGESIALQGNEHGVTTASGLAAALAAKVNHGPTAQVAKFSVSDAMAASGRATMSMTLNGNTFVVAGNEHSTASGAALAQALVNKINGGNSAQVNTFAMFDTSSTANLSITVNGQSYSYIADGTSSRTAASVATLLAGKINGPDIQQKASANFAGTSVAVGMSLSINVNGSSFVVAASQHTAVTEASAAALLAAEIDADSRYNATVSGTTLQITAANGGDAFSISELKIGANAVTVTTTQPNNTAQTAVSATVSGDTLVLTAKNAGTAFTNGQATLGSTAVTGEVITANNIAQTAVTASLSGSVVLLTANTAGEAFTVGSNVAFNTGAAKRVHLDIYGHSTVGVGNFSARGLAASQAIVSVKIEGESFVFAEGQWQGSTMISAANLIAATLNNGGQAQEVALDIASATHSNASITLALNGVTISHQLSAVPYAVTATAIGDQLASIINNDTRFSATIAATNAGGTLTLSARAVGHEAFTVGDVFAGETLLAAASTQAYGAADLSDSVSAVASVGDLFIYSKAGVAVDVSDVRVTGQQKFAYVELSTIDAVSAGASINVDIDGVNFKVVGALTAGAAATALAAAINVGNDFEAKQITSTNLGRLSADVAAKAYVVFSTYTASIDLGTTGAVRTGDAILSAVASGIETHGVLNKVVSAQFSTVAAGTLNINALDAGDGQLSTMYIYVSQTTAAGDALSGDLTLSALGQQMTGRLSAVVVGTEGVAIYNTGVATGLSVTLATANGLTVSTDAASSWTLSPTDFTTASAMAIGITTANNAGHSAVLARVSGESLVLSSLVAGQGFSTGGVTTYQSETTAINMSNIPLGDRAFSITVNGERFALNVHASTAHNQVGSATTAAELATGLASAINGAGAYTKFVLVMDSLDDNESGAVLIVNGTAVSVSFSTGVSQRTGLVGNGGTPRASVASATLAKAFVTAINANSAINSNVNAYASGGHLFIEADNHGAMSFSMGYGFSVGTGSGTVAFSAVLCTIGNGDISDTVSATVSNNTLLIHGKVAGQDVAVERLQVGSVNQGVVYNWGGLSVTAAHSNTANATAVTANFQAQTAVSAKVSGDSLVIAAKDAGTAFTVGDATASTASYTATQVAANDAGGMTAAAARNALVDLVNAGGLGISASENGTQVDLTGSDDGAAVNASLSYAGSDVAYTQTQAGAAATAAYYSAGGNTAAEVAAMMASQVNAEDAYIAAANDGEFTITAAVAGTAFDVSQFFDGTAAVDYTAVTENVEASDEGSPIFAIGTASSASAAIAQLDLSLSTLNEERANIGAVINRLEYAMDNLMNISMNTAESRSRIEDTDYAKATTELARTQIIQQAATAMLAQANQQGQMVLSLLQ